jgi:hypothetical protein
VLIVYCYGMVNEEIVNSTIKRMLDAEIDDDTIISTLKDIGMSDDEAKEQIEKIRNSVQTLSQDQSNSQSQSESSKSQNLNSQDESSIQVSDDSGVDISDDGDSDEKELGEITNQNEKDFQENIAPKPVVEQKEKVDSKLSGQVVEQLSELKAQNNTVLKIMKDVLEVNRKILTELESKK